MAKRFLLSLLCVFTTQLPSVACESVVVRREKGNVVIFHHPDTFDTRAAWNHFQTIAATNGFLSREVLVIGDDAVDVEGCARLIRAAGFKKVRGYNNPEKSKQITYE